MFFHLPTFYRRKRKHFIFSVKASGSLSGRSKISIFKKALFLILHFHHIYLELDASFPRKRNTVMLLCFMWGGFCTHYLHELLYFFNKCSPFANTFFTVFSLVGMGYTFEVIVYLLASAIYSFKYDDGPFSHRTKNRKCHFSTTDVTTIN